MLRTNSLLEEFQHAMVERFSLSVFSLGVVQHGQGVQRRGEAWVFGAGVSHVLERCQVKQLRLGLLATLICFDALDHIMFPTRTLGADLGSAQSEVHYDNEPGDPQRLASPAGPCASNVERG